MQESRLPILIVGAAGELGTHLTRQCLRLPKLLVNVLVRNPDKRKELMDEVKNAGGRVIQGDVTKPETLRDSTKNIHTVVCCLVGDFKTIVDGQNYLLEDALKNGVQRFIPTDFTLDIWGLPRGEHYFIDQRLIFREKLKKSGMKALHCSVGYFMEAFLVSFRDRFTYWGDPDTRFDLTSQEDAAKYVAAAISRPDRVGDLKVSSNDRPFSEYREIYNRVTGRNVELVKGGSVTDLRRKVAEAKEKGDMSTAIGLGYVLFCWDGRGKIKERMNDEFPEVKPTSFEDFLKKYGADIKFECFVTCVPKNTEEEIKTYAWGPNV